MKLCQLIVLVLPLALVIFGRPSIAVASSQAVGAEQGCGGGPRPVGEFGSPTGSRLVTVVKATERWLDQVPPAFVQVLMWCFGALVLLGRWLFGGREEAPPMVVVCVNQPVSQHVPTPTALSCPACSGSLVPPAGQTWHVGQVWRCCVCGGRMTVVRRKR